MEPLTWWLLFSLGYCHFCPRHPLGLTKVTLVRAPIYQVPGATGVPLQTESGRLSPRTSLSPQLHLRPGSLPPPEPPCLPALHGDPLFHMPPPPRGAAFSDQPLRPSVPGGLGAPPAVGVGPGWGGTGNDKLLWGEGLWGWRWGGAWRAALPLPAG